MTWLVPRTAGSCARRALLLLLAIPQVLLAHGGLKSSSPAAESRLSKAPTGLVLEFYERAPLALTQVRLLNAAGDEVALGALRHREGSDEKIVLASVGSALADGEYRIEWRTVGDDGHPVSGTIPFTVVTAATAPVVAPTAPEVPPSTLAGAGAPEPSPTATPPAAERPEVSIPSPAPRAAFDAESPAYVFVRFLTFAGLIVLIGVVVFSTGVLAAVQRNASAAVPSEVQSLAAERTRVLAHWAVRVLALAAVSRLAAQELAVFGTFAPGLPSLRAMLGGTIWGAGWIVQVVGLVLAWVALRAIARSARFGWPMLTGATMLLAITPALSGHAASVDDQRMLAVLADTLHVVGAGGWIGTLVLLLAVGIPSAWALDEGRRELAVATLVRAFSPIALVFAAVLALTGLFAAWLHLPTLDALWLSPYGRTLVLKLLVLGGVAGTGWYNWKRVTPRLETATGVTLLRRTAAVELGIAVVVLLVTAVLVGSPPPGAMTSM